MILKKDADETPTNNPREIHYAKVNGDHCSPPSKYKIFLIRCLFAQLAVTHFISSHLLLKTSSGV